MLTVRSFLKQHWKKCVALVVILALATVGGLWFHWYNTPTLYVSHPLNFVGYAMKGMAPDDFGGVYHRDSFVGSAYRPYFDKRDSHYPPGIDQADTSTLYVVRGSLHTLSYWQKSITYEEYRPERLVYVKYSANEIFNLQNELHDWLTDEAYAEYSFLFTGEPVCNEGIGYRMELLVEGRDAEIIQKLLEEAYGDRIQPLSYDKSYYHWVQAFPENYSYWNGFYNSASVGYDGFVS